MKNPWFRSLMAVSLSAMAPWSLLSRPAYSAPDIWSIDSGEIDPRSYHGETVANGMIGLLSTPEPFHRHQTLINGAYEPLWPGVTYPGGIGCILSVFDPVGLAVAIDGERITGLDQVTHFRQTLGLRDAALTTAFDVRDKASITYRVRALRHLPFSALLEVTVVAKRPLTFVAMSRLEAPPDVELPADVPRVPRELRTYERTVELGHTPRTELRLRAASLSGPSGKHLIAAAQSFLFDEPPPTAPSLTQDTEGLAFTKQLAAGETYHFALLGSTLTTAHVSDPINEAIRVTTSAAVQGVPGLIARHERAWQDLWKSDIVIEGEEETQRDVHGMLYHLYSSVREGSGLSIAPMGLTRGVGGYLGHVFWDAETWMLPAFLALHPELARTMLDYRYERLPAARRNAAARGYRGAKFPWQSSGSGDEDTYSSYWDGEIHVTADVALAAWNYYRVTQDRSWLRERGYPLIKETADFWVSRVERNGPGRYDIKHVVAADEYAADVDNDAFTNAAAKENLIAATAAARILKLVPDPEWEEVRRNIPILRFPTGVTREHATYEGATKQADVILLAYPLKAINEPEDIRRDLTFYSAVTDDNGPAMTKSIMAILYQRLGETQKAYELFKAGYQPNERPPFGALAETPRNANTYFVTGAGGLLQALIYGFGGLDITDAGIVQLPVTLPLKWKSLTLTGIGPRERTYSVNK